eukprot:362044-Chlamydomonas_euryale.AAC.9
MGDAALPVDRSPAGAQPQALLADTPPGRQRRQQQQPLRQAAPPVVPPAHLFQRHAASRKAAPRPRPRLRMCPHHARLRLRLRMCPHHARLRPRPRGQRVASRAGRPAYAAAASPAARPVAWTPVATVRKDARCKSMETNAAWRQEAGVDQVEGQVDGQVEGQGHPAQNRDRGREPVHQTKHIGGGDERPEKILPN